MTDDQLFSVSDVDPGVFVNKFEPKPTSREEARRNLQKALSLQELPPVSHLVSNDHPGTSVAAAVKIRPKIGKLEQIVLDLLAAHPEGLTIFQLVELSGLPYQSISPRPSKLVKKDLIYVSGEGVSPAGNKCQIYKLKEEGI